MPTQKTTWTAVGARLAGTDCVPSKPGVDDEREGADAERAAQRPRRTRGTREHARSRTLLRRGVRPQRREADERRDEDDGRRR